MDFESLISLRIGRKRVLQFLIIYLQHRDTYHVLLALICLRNSFKNLVKSSRNNSHVILTIVPFHSESLSSSSLTIGKYGTVESLKSCLDNRSSAFVINFELRVVFIIDQIIGENQRFFVRIRNILDKNLLSQPIDGYDFSALILDLFWDQRSASHGHFDFFLFLHFN